MARKKNNMKFNHQQLLMQKYFVTMTKKNKKPCKILLCKVKTCIFSKRIIAQYLFTIFQFYFYLWKKINTKEREWHKKGHIYSKKKKRWFYKAIMMNDLLSLLAFLPKPPWQAFPCFCFLVSYIGIHNSTCEKKRWIIKYYCSTKWTVPGKNGTRLNIFFWSARSMFNWKCTYI